MIKQVLLTSKLLQNDESVISVPNSYTNGAFPYWISNPTGATISKIKILAGNINAGVTGGSFTVSLYTNNDAIMSGDDPSIISSGTSAEYIRANWKYQGSLDYSAQDANIEYGHEFKITNMNLSESSFIIGVVNVVGDITVKDIFMWLEYTDNAL